MFRIIVSLTMVTLFTPWALAEDEPATNDPATVVQAITNLPAHVTCYLSEEQTPAKPMGVPTERGEALHTVSTRGDVEEAVPDVKPYCASTTRPAHLRGAAIGETAPQHEPKRGKLGTRGTRVGDSGSVPAGSGSGGGAAAGSGGGQSGAGSGGGGSQQASSCSCGPSDSFTALTSGTLKIASGNTASHGPVALSSSGTVSLHLGDSAGFTPGYGGFFGDDPLYYDVLTCTSVGQIPLRASEVLGDMMYASDNGRDCCITGVVCNQGDPIHGVNNLENHVEYKFGLLNNKPAIEFSFIFFPLPTLATQQELSAFMASSDTICNLTGLFSGHTSHLYGCEFWDTGSNLTILQLPWQFFFDVNPPGGGISDRVYEAEQRLSVCAQFVAGDCKPGCHPQPQEAAMFLRFKAETSMGIEHEVKRSASVGGTNPNLYDDFSFDRFSSSTQKRFSVDASADQSICYWKVLGSNNCNWASASSDPQVRQLFVEAGENPFVDRAAVNGHTSLVLKAPLTIRNWGYWRITVWIQCRMKVLPASGTHPPGRYHCGDLVETPHNP